MLAPRPDKRPQPCESSGDIRKDARNTSGEVYHGRPARAIVAGALPNDCTLRTGAAITAVTNAASVDADAGSIRYVATVIAAPVLSERKNRPPSTREEDRFIYRLHLDVGVNQADSEFTLETELGLLLGSRSGFRGGSGRCRCGCRSGLGGGGRSHGRSGTTAGSRSGVAASGNRSTGIAGCGRSTATALAGSTATVLAGSTAAGSANLALRSLAAGVNRSTAGRSGRSTTCRGGTSAAALLVEERLRVLRVEHRQGHNGHDDGGQRGKLTTHLFFSQKTWLKLTQIQNSKTGREPLPKLCTTRSTRHGTELFPSRFSVNRSSH